MIINPRGKVRVPRTGYYTPAATKVEVTMGRKRFGIFGVNQDVIDIDHELAATGPDKDALIAAATPLVKQVVDLAVQGANGRPIEYDAGFKRLAALCGVPL